MIFVFLISKQNLSSQFFDLDIENPLGEGTLAKRILPVTAILRMATYGPSPNPGF
jgi:hypothetical protein